MTISSLTGEYTEISGYIIDSLDRYVNDGIPPGGFLTAVLANDLTNAFAKADAYNYQMLGDIVRFVFNKVPAAAWGSHEAVDQWIESKRG